MSRCVGLAKCLATGADLRARTYGRGTAHRHSVAPGRILANSSVAARIRRRSAQTALKNWQIEAPLLAGVCCDRFRSLTSAS